MSTNFISNKARLKTALLVWLSFLTPGFNAYSQRLMHELKHAQPAGVLGMNRLGAAAPYYGFESTYGITTNRFALVPYVWLAALDGTLIVNNISTSVNLSLGDVLSNLDPALSLHFDGRSGRYSYWLDGMYLNMSSDPFIASGRTVETSFEYIITEFALTFHTSESNTGIEPFVGGRYTNLYAKIVSTSPLPLSASRRTDWFDPFIGARFTTNLTPRLPAVVRADIGGFGVGSDFAWGLTAGLGFRLTEHIVLTGAYRLLDVDYKSTEGATNFEYNAQQSGALWGIAFLF